MAEEKAIGKPLDRVDGRLKVTGAARYAAEAQVAERRLRRPRPEHHRQGQDHRASTPPRPRRRPACSPSSPTATRREVPLPAGSARPGGPEVGHPLQPLQDDVIHYNGQPIAVVVADTFERATQAAALVRVDLPRGAGRHRLRRRRGARVPADGAEEQRPERPRSRPDYQRGDPDKALRRRRGAGRADLHDPGRAPQPDGAARHRRGLGRAEADPVRQDAVGR